MITKKLFLTTLIPTLTILLILALVNLVLKVPVPLMVQDVTSIGKIHPLSGILSVFGSFLWCSSAVICFFSSYLLNGSSSKEDFKFTLYSGMLSGYLMLDDTFQIHESVSHLNSSHGEMVERFFFGILFVLFLSYILRFKKNILSTKYVVLLLSVCLMGMSIFLDAFYNPTGYVLTKIFRYNLTSWDYLFEDGFKWMGIGFWFTYFFDTCYNMVKKSYLEML